MIHNYQYEAGELLDALTRHTRGVGGRTDVACRRSRSFRRSQVFKYPVNRGHRRPRYEPVLREKQHCQRGVCQLLVRPHSSSFPTTALGSEKLARNRLAPLNRVINMRLSFLEA
jgi:hypothetical protein